MLRISGKHLVAYLRSKTRLVLALRAIADVRCLHAVVNFLHHQGWRSGGTLSAERTLNPRCDAGIERNQSRCCPKVNDIFGANKMSAI